MGNNSTYNDYLLRKGYSSYGIKDYVENAFGHTGLYDGDDLEMDMDEFSAADPIDYSAINQNTQESNRLKSGSLGIDIEYGDEDIDNDTGYPIGHRLGDKSDESKIKSYTDSIKGDSLGIKIAEIGISPIEYNEAATEASRRRNVSMIQYLNMTSDPEFSGPLSDIINKRYSPSGNIPDMLKIHTPLSYEESVKKNYEDKMFPEFTKKYLDPNKAIDSYLISIAAIEGSTDLKADLLRKGVIKSIDNTYYDDKGNPVVVSHTNDNNGIAMLYESALDFEDAFNRYLKDPRANTDGDGDISNKWVPSYLRNIADAYEDSTGIKVTDDMIRSFTVNNPAGRMYVKSDKNNVSYLNRRISDLTNRARKAYDDDLKRAYANRPKSMSGTPGAAIFDAMPSIESAIGKYAVLDKLDNAAETLMKVRRGEGKWLEAFGSGLVDDLPDKAVSSLTFGVSDLVKDSKINGTLIKIGKLLDEYPEQFVNDNIDKLLSETDRINFEVFNTAMAVNQYMANDISGGYETGSAISTTLLYTAEFLLGGGVLRGVSKAATKSLSKIASKNAEKFLSSSVGRSMSRMGTNEGIEFASKTGSKIGRAILGDSRAAGFIGGEVGKISHVAGSSIARSVITPRAYVDAATATINTDDYSVAVGSDFMDVSRVNNIEFSSMISNMPVSLYNNAVEAFTEQYTIAGGVLRGVAMPLKNTKLAASVVNSKWYRGYDDFAKWTKRSLIGRQVDGVWNGIFTEPWEELEGAALKGELDGFFKPENLTNLFAGSLAVSILFGTPGTVNMIKHKNNIRKLNNSDYQYFENLGVNKESMKGLVDIIDTQRNSFKASASNYFAGSVLSSISDPAVKREAYMRLADFVSRNTVNSMVHRTIDPDGKIAKAAASRYIKKSIGKSIIEEANSYSIDGGENIATIKYTDDNGNRKEMYLYGGARVNRITGMVEFEKIDRSVSAIMPGGDVVDFSINDLNDYSIETQSVKDYYNKKVDAIVNDYFDNIDKVNSEFISREAERKNNEKVMRQKILDRINRAKNGETKDSIGGIVDTSKLKAERSDDGAYKFKIDDDFDIDSFDNISDEELNGMLDGLSSIDDINIENIEVESSKVSEEDAIKSRILNSLSGDEFYESLSDTEKDVYLHNAYMSEIKKSEYGNDKKTSLFGFDISKAASGTGAVRLGYSNDSFEISPVNEAQNIKVSMGSAEDNSPASKFMKGLSIARTLFVKKGSNTDHLLEDGAMDGVESSIHVDKVNGEYEIGISLLLGTGKTFEAQLATPAKMRELLAKRFIDKIQFNVWSNLRTYIISAYENNSDINMSIGIGTPKMNTNKDRYGNKRFTETVNTNINEFLDAYTLMYAGEFYQYNRSTGMFEPAEFLNHVGSRTGMSARINAPVISDKVRFAKIYGPLIDESLANILYMAAKEPTKTIGETVSLVDAKPGFSGSRIFIETIGASDMTNAEFISIFATPDISDKSSLRIRDNKVSIGSESFDIDMLDQDAFVSFVKGKTLPVNPTFIFENASNKLSHALNIKRPLSAYYSDIVDLRSDFIDVFFSTFSYLDLGANVFSPEYLFLVPEIDMRAAKSADDLSDESLQSAENEDVAENNIKMKVDDTNQSKLEKSISRTIEKFRSGKVFSPTKFARKLANKMALEGISKLSESMFGVPVIVGTAPIQKIVNKAKMSSTGVPVKDINAVAKSISGVFYVDPDTGAESIYVSKNVLNLKVHEFAHFIVKTIRDSGLSPDFDAALNEFVLSNGADAAGLSQYKKGEVTEEMFCNLVAKKIDAILNESSGMKLLGMMSKSFIESIFGQTTDIKSGAYIKFARDIINMQLKDAPFVSPILKSQSITTSDKRGIIELMSDIRMAGNVSDQNTGNSEFITDYDEKDFISMKSKYPDYPDDVIVAMTNKRLSSKKSGFMRNSNGDLAVFSAIKITGFDSILLEEGTNSSGVNVVLMTNTAWSKSSSLGRPKVIDAGSFDTINDAIIAIGQISSNSDTVHRFSVGSKRYAISSNNSLIRPLSLSNFGVNSISGSLSSKSLDSMARSLFNSGANNSTILAITGRTAYSSPGGKVRIVKPKNIAANISYDKFKSIIDSWPSEQDVRLIDLYDGDGTGVFDAIKDYSVKIRVSDTITSPTLSIINGVIHIAMPSIASRKDISDLISNISYTVMSSYINSYGAGLGDSSKFVFLSRSTSKNENITKDLSDRFDAAIELYNSLYRPSMSDTDIDNLRTLVFNKTGWVIVTPTTGYYASSVSIDSTIDFMRKIKNSAKSNKVEMTIGDFVSLNPSINNIPGISISSDSNNIGIEFTYKKNAHTSGSFSISNNKIYVTIGGKDTAPVYSLTMIHELNHALNAIAIINSLKLGEKNLKGATLNTKSNYSDMSNILADPSVGTDTKEMIILTPQEILNLPYKDAFEFYNEMSRFISDLSDIIFNKSAEDLLKYAGNGVASQHAISASIEKLIEKYVSESKFSNLNQSGYLVALYSAIEQSNSSGSIDFSGIKGTVAEFPAYLSSDPASLYESGNYYPKSLFAVGLHKDISDIAILSDISNKSDLSKFLEARKDVFKFSIDPDSILDKDNSEFNDDNESYRDKITFSKLSEIVDASISSLALKADDMMDLRRRVDELISDLNDNYEMLEPGLTIRSYVLQRYRSLVRAGSSSVSNYKDIFNYIPYNSVDGSTKILSKKVLRSMLRDAAVKSKNFDDFVGIIKNNAMVNHIYDAVVQFESAANMLGVSNYYERLYSAYNKNSSEYTNSVAFNLTEDRRETITKQLLYSIKTRLSNMQQVPEIDEDGKIVISHTAEVYDTEDSVEPRKIEIYKKLNIYSEIKRTALSARDKIVTLYNNINNPDTIENIAASDDIEFYSRYLSSSWTDSEFANRYISYKIYNLLDYICNMVGANFTEDTITLLMYDPSFANNIGDAESISGFIESLIDNMDPININSINEYSPIGSFILELEKVNNRTQDTTIRSITGESHSGIVNKNGFSLAIDKIKAMTDDEFSAFVDSNKYKTNSSLLMAIRNHDVSVLNNLKLNAGEDSPGVLMATDLLHLAKGLIPTGKIASMGVRYYINAEGVIPRLVNDEDVAVVDDFDTFASSMSGRISSYAISEIDSIIQNISIFNSRSLSKDPDSKLIKGYHIDKHGNYGLGCYFSEYMSGLSVRLDGIIGTSKTDKDMNNVQLSDAIQTVMEVSGCGMLDAARLVRNRILEHGVIIDGLKSEIKSTTESAITYWPDEVSSIVNDSFRLRRRPKREYTEEEKASMRDKANSAGYLYVDDYIEYIESLDEATNNITDDAYDSDQDAEAYDSSITDGQFNKSSSIDDEIARIRKAMESSGAEELLSDSRFTSFISNLFLLKRISEIEVSKAIYGNPNEFGSISNMEKRAQSFNTSFTLLSEYDDNSPEFSGNTFKVLDAPDIFTNDNAVGEAGETLGAVLMSPYLYKEIMKRGRGWSDDMERSFNDIMSSDESAREKMYNVHNYFNSLKLIYCGEFDFIGQSLNRIIKAQWFPMFYNKDEEVDKYFKMLVDPNPETRVHAITFGDSVKTGFAEGATHRLPFGRLGMVSIPVSHVGEKTSLLRRLITYGDESIMNAVNSVMMKNVESLYNRIINDNGKINIEYLIDRIKNMNKPVELDAILSIKQVLDADPDFNVFSISGMPSMMFDIITSIVKDAFDIKISGSPYTSMPGVFMSKNRLMYINENNKSDIIVPISMFGDIVKGLNFEEARKKLSDLGYIGKTSHVVILRNPVQSEGSISNANIVDVFPDIYGQAVALPAGFNVASGGDNDGDKVFVYNSDINNDPDINMIISKSVKNKTEEDIINTDKDLKAFLDADKKYPSRILPRFISQYIGESSGLGLVGLAVSLNNGHEILLKESASIFNGKNSISFSNSESNKAHNQKVASAKSGLMSLAVDISKYPMLQENNVDPATFIVLYAYASISGDIDLVTRLMHTNLYEIGMPAISEKTVDIKYLKKENADEIVSMAEALYNNPEMFDDSSSSEILNNLAVFVNTMTSLGSLYMISKKTNDFADIIRNDDVTFNDIIKSVQNIDKRITNNPLSVANVRDGSGLIGMKSAYKTVLNFMRLFSGSSISLNPNFIRATAKTGLRIEEFSEAFNSIGVLREYNKKQILRVLNSVAKKYNLTFSYDIINMNSRISPDERFKLFKSNILIPYIHSVNLSNKTIIDIINNNQDDINLAEFARIYIASCGIGPMIRRMNNISMLFSNSSAGKDLREAGESGKSSASIVKYTAPGTPLPQFYSVLFGVTPSNETEVTIDETTIVNSKYNMGLISSDIKNTFTTSSVDKSTSGNVVNINMPSGNKYTFNTGYSQPNESVLYNTVFSIENNLGVISLQIKPNTLSSIIPQLVYASKSTSNNDVAVIGSEEFSSKFHGIDNIKHSEMFDPNADYDSKLIIVDPSSVDSSNISSYYDYAERTGSTIIFSVNNILNAPSSLYSGKYEDTMDIYSDFGTPEDINKIISDNSNRTIISVNRESADIINSADQKLIKDRFMTLPGREFSSKLTGVKKLDDGSGFVVKIHGSEKLFKLSRLQSIRGYMRINEMQNVTNKSVLIITTKGYPIESIMSNIKNNDNINNIKIVEIDKSNSSYSGLSNNDEQSKFCAV